MSDDPIPYVPPEGMKKVYEEFPCYLNHPHTRFPEELPPNCTRNCKRFFVNHNKTLSLSLYAPIIERSRTICAYASCCGAELHGVKFKLEEGETPADLMRRIIPTLIRIFVEMADKEPSETNA